MDAFDHQHAILGFDFAYGVRGEELFAGRDLTRFQRAAKGAG